MLAVQQKHEDKITQTSKSRREQTGASKIRKKRSGGQWRDDFREDVDEGRGGKGAEHSMRRSDFVDFNKPVERTKTLTNIFAIS